MQNVKLSNGVEMPTLGYGVFQVTPEECYRCVRDAIDVGYRSIDTAQAYQNEAQVGDAVRDCGVPREDLFLTSKIWISHAGQEAAAASIDASLKKLKTDYLDLMLIHQPFGDCYGTWRALEAALDAGKVRAIGVSNFYPDRLIDIAEFNRVKPMVNQVEAHVFNQQVEARAVMQRLGCVPMAWAPLAEGRNGLFTDPTLAAIGARHGKTAAQVALRWLVECGVVIIPKSTHRERMIENMSIFDFALTADDMAAIAAMDLKQSQWFDHRAVDTVLQFMQWAKSLC